MKEMEADEYNKFAEHMETTYRPMFTQPYGGFAIGVGWWSIVERLCRQIQYHIDTVNKRRAILLVDNPHDMTIPDEVEQVVVAQIKEKFGGLRFYYDGGDDYIRGLVQMAEEWASKTCEECGNRGEARGDGWVQTLCDFHDQERKLKRFGAQ